MSLSFVKKIQKRNIIVNLLHKNEKITPTHQDFQSEVEKLLCEELRISPKRLDKIKVKIFCDNARTFFKKTRTYTSDIILHLQNVELYVFTFKSSKRKILSSSNIPSLQFQN